MKHHEIYFKAYHSDSNNGYEGLRPASGGSLEQLWDGYNDFVILEDILPLEQIRKFHRARILQGSNRQAIFSAKEKGCIVHNDPLEDVPDDRDVFVIHLRSWALLLFRAQVADWMERVCLDSEHVGGDDSTFDYYPDNWEVALQITKALGMEETYRMHYTHLTTPPGVYSDADNDLPSYIPSW